MPSRSFCLLIIGALLTSGCSRLPLPQVSLPGRAAAQPPAADRTATPRDLLGARLLNPRARDDMPNMTVGKLIEYADRYLACDCATTRFVRAWEPITAGWRLVPNSELVRPLEFVCQSNDDQHACFLTEIDRGAHTGDLAERFIPGSQFIEFLYDNGVRCAREAPCP